MTPEWFRTLALSAAFVAGTATLACAQGGSTGAGGSGAASGGGAAAATTGQPCRVVKGDGSIATGASTPITVGPGSATSSTTQGGSGSATNVQAGSGQVGADCVIVESRPAR